ncbi:hypothetical protein PIB30_081284 [Stylosanthes scabra]|uniref:Retrotransposon gag domain-containing protein n=1 Tax=Stylosanthes scabra TaxID=79078 RepID=A0ABU6USE5_9FABA|nr:hypothetical protein [Stylosanthes scabra]
MPGEDSIKHLKDIDVICATTRRTGGDEDAVKAFAFSFSLEGRAKDWYHTLSGEPQGWRDNQQNRWNSPQQLQQTQFCQPYTCNQPQNPQNQRYQPPHTRETYHPPNVPPPNYEETLHAYQQESREMKETQKRFESQLSHITELPHKFTNQQTINLQSQPSTSSPLPSQPLPNPKGGINMVQNENNEEEEKEDDDDWLYELLAELA